MIMKLILSIVFIIFSTAFAFAEAELPPKGTCVSAVVDKNKAIIKISGVVPTDIEFYSYEGIKHLNLSGSKNEFAIDLNKGRRFNFRFNNGKYVLLVPEMAADPPSFFGKGIGLDCSNDNGCCFLILIEK